MDLLFSVKEKKAELFTLVSILRIFWLRNLYTLTKGPSLLIYTYLLFYGFLRKLYYFQTKS
jgi:hypothetical protein